LVDMYSKYNFYNVKTKMCVCLVTNVQNICNQKKCSEYIFENIIFKSNIYLYNI